MKLRTRTQCKKEAFEKWKYFIINCTKYSIYYDNYYLIEE